MPETTYIVNGITGEPIQVPVPKGQVDISDLEKSTDEHARAMAREMLASDNARRKQISERGALSLPALLDQRRLDYGIIDGAFQRNPSYDWIAVYQIPWNEGDTFEGSALIRPETTKAREKEEAARGVLIGAGLLALDALRSNGIDLGHIVTFIKLAPWRLPAGYVAGHTEYVLMLKAGDIVASEDLQRQLRSGACKIESSVNEHGVREHTLVDADGCSWRPQEGYQPGGY